MIEVLIVSNYAGKTRARDAALNAIQSPLLDLGIERATGIVWNITGGNDLTLFEVNLSFTQSPFLCKLNFFHFHVDCYIRLHSGKDDFMAWMGIML